MTSSTPTSPTLTSPSGLGPVFQITKVDQVPPGSTSPRPDSRPQSTPPPEVRTDNESGVEDGALELAKQFMTKMGNLARKCTSRGALSELYLTTQSAWASQDVLADESLQRHFKQVLFAIAHGMKLVRVRDQGRSLFWNRYRDNEGNQLEDERAKYTDRQQDQRGGGGERRDDRRGGGGERRDYRDDRRGGGGERRDYRDDRRGGGGERRDYRDDRRGGGGERRDYRDDRRGGGGERRDDRRGGGGGERRAPRSTEPDSNGWITVGGNSRTHNHSA